MTGRGLPTAPRTMRARRPLAVLLTAVLVALMLPAGALGQSPDQAAATDPAATATPSPTTTPGDAGSDVAAAAPFRFRWRAGIRGTPATNRLVAGGMKVIRFSLGGNRGLAVLADGWP